MDIDAISLCNNINFIRMINQLIQRTPALSSNVGKVTFIFLHVTSITSALR